MSEKKMTAFGLKIYHWAADYAHAYSWAELERLLVKAGLEVSRQQISNYVFGESTATAEFTRYFSVVANLDEDKRRELAYSWAFEQEREDKEPFRTPVYKVAEQVGWDEDERREYAFRYVFGSDVLIMST